MDGSMTFVAPESLHGRVMQDLLDRITTGAIPPGGALPTEAALCRQYDVSRITVRRAIADLALRGLVTSRRGVGSFATAGRDGVRTVRLTGFLDESRPFQMRTLSDRTGRADAAVSGALGLPAGAPVRHLRSLVHFEGEPYTISDSHTRPGAGPVTMGPGGLRLGQRIERAEQELDAVAADRVVAEHLGVRRGTPVMRARRTYLAQGGRPIQYLVVRYHPSHYRFLADLLPRQGAATYQVEAQPPSG